MRFSRAIAAALALLVGAAEPLAAAPDRIVTDMRVARHAGLTRVVFDVDRATTFDVFALAAPPRIVVDLPEVGWRLPTRPLPPPTGVYTRVRYGLHQPGNSRAVIDLAEPAEIVRAFLLETASRRGYRLVVDLDATPPAHFAGIVGAPPVRVTKSRRKPPASPPRAAPAAAAVAKPKANGAYADTRARRNGAPRGRTVATAALPAWPVPRRKPRARPPAALHVVVIDPGHGGADPGAIGISGRYEKHLVLAAAREIRRVLRDRRRYRVVLTRDRDVFVPLKQRVQIARDAGADLFISVHADSIRNKRVKGPSVYTLSEKASDKEAAALAERENKADLIGGVDLSHESREVTNILIDLAQRETMNSAGRFAAQLVGALKRKTQVLRNTHRFAGFRVLKAPDVPSVLLEMGFLSNPVDERRLDSKNYRRRLAKAVANAVDTYFDHIEQARAR